MAYNPKGCWRQLRNDPSIAVRYLRHFNVTHITEEMLAQESNPRSLLEELPNIEEIDAPFRDICEMADETGQERFIEFASQDKTTLSENFYHATSHIARSICVWLENRDLFDETFLWNEFTDYNSEYHFQTIVDATYITSDNTIEKLKEDLQSFFEKQSKAKDAKVDYHYRASTKCHRFTLHYSDLPVNEDHFVAEGTLQSQKRVPVKLLSFFVFEESKTLKLYYPRGKSKKQELIKLFLNRMLDEEFVVEGFSTLNLEKLKENFKKDFEPAHNIEYFRVKALKFSKTIGDYKETILLDANEGNRVEDIYLMLDRYHIPLDNPTFKVSYAKIHFQFRNKGRKGSVTLNLTAPNSDDFKESPLHEICRNYLIQWGIILH